MQLVSDKSSVDAAAQRPSPWVANLAALWCVDSTLARQIEALDLQSAYPVEVGRSGEMTLRIASRESGPLYLHSRYRPVEEARQLIDSIDTSSCVAFYVHGLGLGYHLQELFSRASDEAIICVLEPDLRLIRTALEHHDLSEVIRSGRVLFFTQVDRTLLLEKLTSYSAMFVLGFTPVVHAPSWRLHTQFHTQMRQCIDDFLAYAKTNINTLVINGQRTAENITRNIGWYLSTPGVGRLAGRYCGKPAIVVSAGPSLRKNKHLLKDAQDHAVIVAVQTALRPLVDIGVEPHFVTSLDYHEICTRFFEKLPTHLRSELVAEPKATNGIFSMFPGPVSLLASPLAESLLREMKLDRAPLRAGTTVAHLAYYLAEHLGCDPIIFIGQDLGFSDGLCYTPGTSYENVWRPELGRFCTLEMKQWEQIVRDRPILRRTPDIHGNPMYTEQRLFTYLQQFERDFASTHARIIDATEGGARMNGSVVMSLTDALAQYCTQPVGRLSDRPDKDTSRWPQAVECLLARQDEAQQIQKISEETLPLLEQIREHLSDQARVNRLIARVDVLRMRMNQYSATYDIIMQLAQSTQLDQFKQDRLIASEHLKAEQKQRRQVGRDIKNVQGVAEAARLFQQLVQTVIDQLRAQSDAAQEAA